MLGITGAVMLGVVRGDDAGVGAAVVRRGRSGRYWRVKTAWTTMVLSIAAMPSQFQVRPKSARLTGISASSHTSPSTLVTVASKDTGRVCPRTVRLPVTRTPPLAGATASTAKVSSGWVATSKKAGDRRCLSRWLFLVSADSAATVTVPVTSPAAVTLPLPVTRWKTPCSGRSPQVCRVFSWTVDLAGSSVQDPVSVPSCRSACRAGEVSCPDGAMSCSRLIWFGYQNGFDIGTVYTLGSGCQGEGSGCHGEGSGGQGGTA